MSEKRKLNSSEVENSTHSLTRMSQRSVAYLGGIEVGIRSKWVGRIWVQLEDEGWNKTGELFL